MTLYKKSKTKVDQFEKDRMEHLEHDLDIESIITYRNLVNEEIRLEKKNNPDKQKQGWFGWLGSWWGKPAPKEEVTIGSPQFDEYYDEDEDEEYDEELDREGRKHIYETIGYSEELDEFQMPKNVSIVFTIANMAVCSIQVGCYVC
jgi:hypothetical protein